MAEVRGEESEEADNWIATHLSNVGSVDSDFGLHYIAKHLGRSDALELYWQGARLEELCDFNGAITMYKRAYRMWPALDSIPDGGVPRGVRLEAESAGMTSRLLQTVDVASARASCVVCSCGLLSASDIDAIDATQKGIVASESLLVNNPQNATHIHKVDTK
jgi:hypothetical protein